MKWKIFAGIVTFVFLLAIFLWIYVGLIDMFDLEYFPILIIAPIALIILCVLVIALTYYELRIQMLEKKKISGLKTTSTVIYVCLFAIFVSVIVLVSFLAKTYYR